MTIHNVVAIPPHVRFAYQRMRKLCAVAESEEASRLVVRVDVVVGRGEDGRSFNEGDVLSREMSGECADDVCLKFLCFL